jgi:hypothetical protein
MENQNLESAFNEASEQPDTDQIKTASLGDIAQIRHLLADGIYIKAYAVPAGVKLYSKLFPDDHVTILAQGSVLLKNEDGTIINFVAPAHFKFPANKRLGVVTLQPSVWYCVHATDETDLAVLAEKY